MMDSDDEVIFIEDNEPPPAPPINGASSFVDENLGNKDFESYPLQESETMEEDEDEQPKIFLRNFAEIKEPDSDDDEEVTVTIVEQNQIEGERGPIKNLQHRNKGVQKPSKLMSIATYDDSKLEDYGFEMTAEVGPVQNPNPAGISRTKASKLRACILNHIQKKQPPPAKTFKLPPPPPIVVKPAEPSPAFVRTFMPIRLETSQNTASQQFFNQALASRARLTTHLQRFRNPQLAPRIGPMQTPVPRVPQITFNHKTGTGLVQTQQYLHNSMNPQGCSQPSSTSRSFPIVVSAATLGPTLPPPTHITSSYPKRNGVNVRVPSSPFQPPSPIVSAVSAPAPLGVTIVPTPTTIEATGPPQIVPAPPSRIRTPQSSQQQKPSTSKVTAGSQKAIPSLMPREDKSVQNKTFPSLVVKPEPFLTPPPNRVQLSKLRSQLDQLVKSTLAKTPAEFIEFLIQRGLLRINPRCPNHPENLCQLAMYSTESSNSPDNTSKSPYSGGYIWVRSCCPNTNLSVFHNSLFQNSPYPPGTLLKLMYHWACQTPVASILQWVPVTGTFLKAFYTQIRSLCRVYLDEVTYPMGGEGKIVEVGIVTLNSTTETTRGTRSTTVEILGCFDRATKMLRMKVVNCQLYQASSIDKNPALESGSRAFMIMVTLSCWINPQSTILTDSVINRSILLEVGFQNIRQCSNEEQGILSNCNVMKYLRTTIPKMLQSTLCVLSKSLVQQFLDELTWREKFGTQMLVAYHNLINQIGIVTKWELPQGQTLTGWLDKVAQEPWIDCSYSKRENRSPHKIISIGLRNEPGIKECLQHISKELPKRKYGNAFVSATAKNSPLMQQKPQLRQNVTASSPRAAKRRYDEAAAAVASTFANDQQQCKDYYRDRYRAQEKNCCLQKFYYGTWKANQRQTVEEERDSFPQTVKCPLCIRTFQAPFDIIRHLWNHISKLGMLHGYREICRICLSSLLPAVSMELHIRRKHMRGSLDLACRICEKYFNSQEDLIVHMWDLHQAREAPYNCSICGFCTSFHSEIISHFDKMHGMEAKLLCPLCLQVFNCATSSQLSALITHLQSHWQYERKPKKCERCCLSFCSDQNLAAHMHQHNSRDDSIGRWVTYQVGNSQQELQVMMGTPPKSLHPLNVAISERQWESILRKPSPTPAKKPKKRPESLNVPEAVAIDTDEVFGGSWYPIQIKKGDQGICQECGEDIAKPKHFVGRLFCTQTNCRFQTACRKSMDIHLETNHAPGRKVKPAFKTKPVKQLGEVMYCKCGYQSSNPTRLAEHLIECEKYTVYPKIPETEMQETGKAQGDEIGDAVIEEGNESGNRDDQCIVEGGIID